MNTDFLSANWESLFKGIGLIAGVVATIYQIVHNLPESRSRLKLDLEILGLVSATDPSYKLMKDSINTRISEIYGAEASTATDKFQAHNWFSLIIGSCFLLGFGSWTVYLFAWQGSWWGFLTAFFALGGFGNIMSAFTDRKTASAQGDKLAPQPTGELV